jgi:DNA-binding response OmpR family regulator
MPSVLIVEDDPYVRECLYRGFKGEGWRVYQVGSPAEALEWVAAQSFDLVLADVMMPGMNGTEMVSRIRAVRPEIRALLMSGLPEAYLQRKDCDTQIAPLLQKPFPIRTVVARATAMMPKNDWSDQPIDEIAIV